MIKCFLKRIKNYQNKKNTRSLKNLIAPDSTFTELSSFDANSKYEGGNYIHEGVVFTGEIGYGSYIGPNTTLPKTSIGRYCSISWDVQLISGRHPSKEFVSTHPAFFSTMKQSGFTYVKEQLINEYKYADQNRQFLAIIGNDVWIGANVIIMEGVRIGDGAIIGAGSVVTKDVPPYAIVGGAPAKVLRFRFSEDEIAFLSEFQWWDKGKDWIENHANYFSDIKLFREKCINE